MEKTSIWVEELAKEVTPNEVDLAEAITTAYIKGGKTRQKLLKRKKGGSVGGFGGGGIILLSHILNALTNSSILLYTLLASGALNNFISLVKSAIELREQLQMKADKKKLQENKEELLERLHKDIPASPENEALIQFIVALSEDLKSTELSLDKRELLALRIFLAVSKYPEQSKEAVQELHKNK